jgi:hypothetical protein
MPRPRRRTRGLETLSWPEPKPGLVIRYAYLWDREAKLGRDEGVKDRPCAVVVALKRENGETVVYALPITHTVPRTEADGLELPASTKSRLGLDNERAWIVVTEANIFEWPGPDLRFAPGGGQATIAYGLLPARILREVQRRFAEVLKARRAGLVRRT